MNEILTLNELKRVLAYNFRLVCEEITNNPKILNYCRKELERFVLQIIADNPYYCYIMANKHDDNYTRKLAKMAETLEFSFVYVMGFFEHKEDDNLSYAHKQLKIFGTNITKDFCLLDFTFYLKNFMHPLNHVEYLHKNVLGK